MILAIFSQSEDDFFHPFRQALKNQFLLTAAFAITLLTLFFLGHGFFAFAQYQNSVGGEIFRLLKSIKDIGMRKVAFPAQHRP
jgi:hypothetical protein